MMIEPHDKLSHAPQCHLLGLARSTYYYQPQPVSDVELALLRKMDEQYEVFLILDNLCIHHSKPVKAWLIEHQDKIESFYPLSYSLELNPEE